MDPLVGIEEIFISFTSTDIDDSVMYIYMISILTIHVLLVQIQNHN